MLSRLINCLLGQVPLGKNLMMILNMLRKKMFEDLVYLFLMLMEGLEVKCLILILAN